MSLNQLHTEFDRRLKLLLLLAVVVPVAPRWGESGGLV